MCQLLVKRAECRNTFEGLTNEGERAIASELELMMEVPFLDETRCRLKGISERKFAIHIGDLIEIENKNGETIANIKILSGGTGCRFFQTKEENDVLQSQGSGEVNLGLDFDVRVCDIAFKEK